MIFYTNGAEFAAHILQFYRFYHDSVHVYIPPSDQDKIIINRDNVIVTLNSGQGPDCCNGYDIYSTSRTMCQLAYDAAKAWRVEGWYRWLKNPSFIPYQKESHDFLH